MKKLVLLFFIFNVFLITSCSKNLKNVVLAPPVAVSALDRRGEELAKIDRSIEEDIADELNNDESLVNQSHLNVAVYGSAVLLTGEIANETLKTKIIETVRVISHVKEVRDYLLVGKSSDGLSRSQDKKLAANVKKALNKIALSDFNPRLLKIVVERGAVYLMGQVHREEGSIVINVARLEPDVKQIVTLFEYLD